MGTVVAPKVVALGSATVSNSAKAISHEDFGFTSAQLLEADHARITARSAGVMFTYDGATNPTPTIGHLLTQDETVIITGMVNIGVLRFIRESGSDAVVTITLEAY
jgi:hypothetical protein